MLLLFLRSVVVCLCGEEVEPSNNGLGILLPLLMPPSSDTNEDELFVLRENPFEDPPFLLPKKEGNNENLPLPIIDELLDF